MHLEIAMLLLSLVSAIENKAVSIGILYKKLSQHDREIIRNTTLEAKLQARSQINFQINFWRCSGKKDLFILGQEIQQYNTSLVISIDCSNNINDFINKILKISVISLCKNDCQTTSRKDSVGHMIWRQPRSETFSNTVNQLLIKQDWDDVAVLYDANHGSIFKNYVRASFGNFGGRRSYPLHVHENGTVTGYSLERLKIFANFSIHAVVLMCEDRHLQSIVNMIKTVNRSHARMVPALVLHNPISRRYLSGIEEAQMVIGLRANHSNKHKNAKNGLYMNHTFNQNNFSIVLSHAMQRIIEGIVRCFLDLKQNESLKLLLHGNLTKYIENAASSDYHLDIFNLHNGSFVKIGSATNNGKTVTLWSKVRANEITNNHVIHLNRPLRVVTIHDPPFVTISKLANGTKAYKGFLIDILNEMKRLITFDYVLHEIEDDEYGSFVDGKWIGMVGDVFYDKADLGLAPFTVDEVRSKIISFVQPFMKAHVAYLMKKRAPSVSSITQFLEPFTTNVWLTILTSIFVVTFSIFFVDYVGPNGWRQYRLKKEGKDGKQFSLFNSLWFTIGCILRQGTYVTPKSLPSRFLVSVFWFIVLIQMSSYTANLAAYFTFKKSFTEIQDLETLAKMDYNILIFRHSVIHTQLQTATYQPYRMIYEKIAAHDAFVHYFEEGVEQIRNSTETTTILLSESPFLEDLANKKPCDLISVNSFLPVRSYAFVVQFNSPLYDTFSVAISKLQESGYIEARRRFYWDESAACKAQVDQTGTGYGRITAMQMIGVYAVLLGGIVMSFLTFILEMVWKHYHIKRATEKVEYEDKDEKKEKTKQENNI